MGYPSFDDPSPVQSDEKTLTKQFPVLMRKGAMRQQNEASMNLPLSGSRKTRKIRLKQIAFSTRINSAAMQVCLKIRTNTDATAESLFDSFCY